MDLSCLTQKIEFNYIIPALRKKFLILLEKQNLKDSEIAKKLKVTKSTVSQYKHKKRAKDFEFPKTIEKEIENSSRLIKNGKDVNIEILKIINKIKKSRYICNICKECEKYRI